MKMVFGHADAIGFALQGKFDFQIVLLRAKDDADGWVIVGRAFFFIQQIEIEIHLAGILGLEGAYLQFKSHECFNKPVVEEQVDEVLFLPQHEAVLAAHKAKNRSRVRE